MSVIPERLTCREVRATGAFAADVEVQWSAPAPAADRAKLNEWCQNVGPAVVYAPVPAVSPIRDKSNARILLVNWNVHLGRGDIRKLRSELTSMEIEAGRGSPDFVMLIQESFRRGLEVPTKHGPRSNIPGRIATGESEIEEIAHDLGWWLYYVPSMRNGSQSEDAEDRGNAILSSLPLEDFAAVELPFVVQRRVAALATVVDEDRQLRFNVAAVHFDTRAPLFQGSIFGGPSARDRQARALQQALAELHNDGAPLFIGGDLNTQSGAGESSVKTLAQHATRLACEGEPTFKFGFTLDHVFYRGLPSGWEKPDCLRWDDRLNSDHHPLVVAINAG